MTSVLPPVDEGKWQGIRGFSLDLTQSMMVSVRSNVAETHKQVPLESLVKCQCNDYKRKRSLHIFTFAILTFAILTFAYLYPCISLPWCVHIFLELSNILFCQIGEKSSITDTRCCICSFNLNYRLLLLEMYKLQKMLLQSVT